MLLGFENRGLPADDLLDGLILEKNIFFEKKISTDDLVD
jgi:hypothetical protein